MLSMPKEDTSDNPLVIVGKEDVVLGFSALGFKTYALKNEQELKSTLDEIVQSKAAICLVEDNFYRIAYAQINNYRQLPLTVFIPFSKTHQTDLLDEMIKEIRLKATGAF